MKITKLLVIFLALTLLFSLSGCGCEHEFGGWVTTKAATCTDDGEEAKTCSVCKESETRAIAAKHNWNPATCTAAKTCSVCGLTEGDATDHDWSAATCTEAKKCKVCGEKEGSALGHSFGTDVKCSRCEELVARTSGDYRLANFGDSIDIVKAYETLTLLSEDSTTLLYEANFNGVDCALLYIFNDKDQLCSVGIFSVDNHTNGSEYLYDFEDLLSYLVKNFGDPDSDKEAKGSLYKYCNSKGEALELEEYARQASWAHNDYTIMLTVKSDNYDIMLGAALTSTKYTED